VLSASSKSNLLVSKSEDWLTVNCCAIGKHERALKNESRLPMKVNHAGRTSLDNWEG
jgi:hypothetical protein